MTITEYEFDPAIDNFKQNGQQESYLILGDEERSKGFIRPVRTCYIHVGAQGPTYPLRDLSEDEKEQHAKWRYVKFEQYPEDYSPVTGRYWTQEQLDQIGNGCGAKTQINQLIAETYARDPSFYGSTFCATCKKHFPVEQFVWTDDRTRVGS